eukprot:5186005-Amphidinium_carterae.1
MNQHCLVQLAAATILTSNAWKTVVLRRIASTCCKGSPNQQGRCVGTRSDGSQSPQESQARDMKAIPM